MQKKPASKPKQTQAELRKQLATANKKLEHFQQEQKIEAALDSVRARALAMRESSELREVVAVLYQKLQELEFGIDQGAALVMTFSPESNDHTQWITDARQTYAIPFIIPYTNHSISRDQLNVRKKSVSFHSKVYRQKEKNEYFKYLFQHTGYKQMPKEIRQLILNSKKFGISIAFEKNSAIAIPSTIGKLVSSKEKIILKRFSKVFEQCYTRFLDLQKAEAQAREAQIEVALERVRARTMAMQKSEELQEAANLLFKQIQSLGIPVWSCGYNIWKKGDDECIGWMSSEGMLQPPFKIPLKVSPTFIRFKQSRERGEAFYVEEIGGKALASHYNFMMSLPDFAAIAKKQIEEGYPLRNFQVNHVVNFTHGNLIFITDKPVPAAHDVFKRFAKVFEQTYTRFLDLQRAEAQAREAQIEAALERVRARAMAMHTSEDLKEVAKELRKQIGLLGQEELNTCVIQLYDESPDYVHSWVSITQSENRKEKSEFYGSVPKKGLLIIEESLRAYLEGRKDYTLLNEQTKLKQWMIFLKETNPDSYDVIVESYNGFRPEDVPVFWSYSDFNGGSLLMVTLTPPTESARTLLRRFANVFELAYRRFLDLKKAEAQAREAQIEAALEKVRSRSLAMHKSDELKEVVVVVFEKLKELGLTFDVAGIQLYSEGTRDIIQWVAAPGLASAPVLAKLPFVEEDFKESEIIQDIWAAKEKGKNINSKHYSFEEKNKFFAYAGRYNDLNAIPEVARQIQMQAPSYTQSLVAAKHSSLWVDSYSGQKISDEEFNFLGRFAKVFEQAYVRFLDLQKAEAQAREAQIQLALERVRARTMAMHQSSELADAAVVLFDQLKLLGVKVQSCGFAICEKDSDTIKKWMTNVSGKLNEPLYFKTTDLDEGRMYNAWKNQLELESYVLTEADLKQAVHEIMKSPRLKEMFTPLFSGNDISLPTWQQNYIAPFKQGYLLILAKEPFEEAAVFTRFAKVFEQTYTRFLDLQKAEAQAREAQIEAALEKIRSRSLAMHHSDEISEVIGITHKTLAELNVKHDTIAFQIFEFEKKSSFFWPGNNLQDVAPKVVLPFDNEIMKADTCHRDLWTAMATGEAIINKVYIKAQKDRWFEYVFAHNDSTVIESHARKFILQSEIHTVCFFPEKNSGLFADSWDGTKYTQEDIEVLKRAARVFEQAYVRFLDLKKAEAQAREAQIEAALERVRSRSMGMQRGEDLKSVVNELYDQLKVLGFKSGVAAIQIIDEVTGDMDVWMEGSEDGYELPERYHVPFFNHSSNNQHLENWKNGKGYSVIEMSGSEKRAYDNYFFLHTDFVKIPDHTKDFMMSQGTLITSAAYMKYGAIGWAPSRLNEEQATVLQRFAKVFEQTYTRFLDLQKAEAQAREAQIEAALERVRSRSMAMQQSDEIMDVAVTLYDQLQKLEFEPGSLSAATIIIMDKESGYMEHWLAGFIEKNHIESYEVNNVEHPVHSAQLAAWRRGEKFATFEISGKEVKAYADDMFANTGYRKLSDEEKVLLSIQEHVVFNLAYMAHGALMWAPNALSEPNAVILQRFAKVFEQTYTRFLDLQRAEAQAREAQIEAALERVRSRSMGMQRGTDLKSVVKELYDQLRKLGFQWGAASICIMDDATGDIDWWMEGFEDGYDLPEKYHVPYFDHPGHKQQIGHWKAGSKYVVIEISGQEKKTYDNYYFFQTDFVKAPENTKNLMMSQQSVIFSMAYLKYGALSWSPTRLDEEQAGIMQRFANVFEQTYTRFLDLQRAEAQAREAQIETALERVRSRSLAMHRSDELEQVAATLFEAVVGLGIAMDGALLFVFNRENKNIGLWIATVQLTKPVFIDLPYEDTMKDNEVFVDYWNTIASGGQLLNRVYSEKAKNDYFRYVQRHNSSKIPDQLKQLQIESPAWNLSFVAEKNTMLGLDSWSGHQFTEADLNTLRKFARTFEQAYTRFLDLQRAEAQAREAQIEAALERVRAQTIAMHNSEDVGKCVIKMFDELTALGVDERTRFGIGILNHDNENNQLWTAKKDGEEVKLHIGNLDMASHPLLKSARKAWKDQAPLHKYVLEGDDLLKYYHMLNSAPDYKIQIPIEKLPERELHYGFIFEHGFFYAFTHHEFQPDVIHIIQRFTSLFAQTYRRYLDLVKAEEQAREAQIEAALERIRSRSMAMHKSDELLNVITVVSEQLQLLGLKFNTVSFAVNNREHDYKFWFVAMGDTNPTFIKVPYISNPMYDRLKDVLASGVDFYSDTLTPEESRHWHEHLFTHAGLPNLPEETKAYILRSGYARSIAIMPSIMLVVSNYAARPYTQDENDIIKRMATVFQQSYTRFLDLQKAEAQAIEAIKQSSLDRVRGEIASMRTAEDLNRITPLIWKELTALSIPFSRCGVFIMDDAENQIHTFLSTPDGNAIAAFNLPMDNPGNLEGAVEHWRHHQVFVTHWVDKDFQAQADLLMQLGAITSRNQYLSKVPDGGIYLHLLPFMHGMLYVGNTAPLSEDELNLVQSLADAFSVAYARYEDFRQLELAKKEVDKAFAELKQAQQQLVQSEKMASLGELTAGIAHEIQNPLNFVNNFSEVSKELLDEMKHELEQGNSEEVKAIARDIIQNLEKITFHGKRADAIVKSMLQHSRSSSGKKELTDINALCDEYLRLAYHGYRAKDKSFNARFETHLDPSLPKVNVMAQDIGRVVLNLINNAFYACTSASKNQPSSFDNPKDPLVIVSTKNLGDKIQITVTDNGPGIPDSIKDKIFQPFFTTKPTGQGTGLGLSLSYDIIAKGHGGKLMVESREGEGSVFKITVPIA